MAAVKSRIQNPEPAITGKARPTVKYRLYQGGPVGSIIKPLEGRADFEGLIMDLSLPHNPFTNTK
jgi:hypothetical protein